MTTLLAPKGVKARFSGEMLNNEISKCEQNADITETTRLMEEQVPTGYLQIIQIYESYFNDLTFSNL